MRRSLAAALLLVSASGCAALRDLAAGTFERPRLTFEAVSADGLDLDGVTLSLRYRIDNPNTMGLSVAKLGYALEVEGRPVFSGSLPGGLQIPARGAAPLVIPVRLGFASLGALVEALLTRETVAYRVSGSVGLDTPVGLVELPYEHRGTAPVPRAPALSIESVQLASEGLTRIGIDLRIRVANRNPFLMPAGQLAYSLDVAGASVVGGQSHAVPVVQGGGSTLLVVPVRLDLLGGGSAAARMLAGGPVEVSLRGAASFGWMRLPLDLRGRTSR
jgi:LEA14-like dessication related protein